VGAIQLASPVFADVLAVVALAVAFPLLLSLSGKGQGPRYIFQQIETPE
jgi:hypothetical protein